MNRKPLSIGDYLIAILFAAMIVIIAAQVVARYVLDNSLVWTEELSRYVFVWMTFVGAMLAIKEGAHIRVTILDGCLSAGVRKCLALFSLLLIIAFLAVVVWVGFGVVRLTSGQTTPALNLPLNYALYASLPMASLFGIWFAVRKAVTILRSPARQDRSEV